MNRAKLVNGVIEYLKSPHWNDFLNILIDPERSIWHAHIFIDMMIHPDSFNTILEEYFIKRGHELKRKIDYLSPRPNIDFSALHNIHPDGWPHFDLFYSYSPDKVMAPMDPERGESGKNALHWGRAEMDEFYNKHKFIAVGPQEEQKIREYFSSRHWKDTLRLVMDPDVIHVHCNLQISFDPKILELIARDVLAAQGWTIDKVVPNMFKVKNEYRGKLVFLGRSPERVYDMGWIYNPGVVIAPSYEPWARNDVQPGFDLCLTSETMAFVNSKPFIKLTDDEIKTILAAI